MEKIHSQEQDPPPDPPPSWWDKVKRTAKAAKGVAAVGVLVNNAIGYMADNAKWKTYRWTLLERTKSCLREWARVELVESKRERLKYEDMLLSAFASLREQLKQDSVLFKPGRNRHKPDILIEHSLALRFLLYPNPTAINDLTSELVAMSKAFSTFLVICYPTKDVWKLANQKLAGRAGIELVCLPGGIPSWPPPKLEGMRIFVSYNERDAKWMNRLKVHINPLRKLHHILLWDNSVVLPGEDPRAERIAARSTANILIILLSADYLDIECEEQQAILDRAEMASDKVQVFLLYVGHCNPDIFPRLLLQCSINQPEEPLNSMDEHKADAILNKVGPEIERQLKNWCRLSK